MRLSTAGRSFAAGAELAVGDTDRLAILNDHGKSRDLAKATNPLCGLQASRTSYDAVHVGSVEKGYRALCGKCFNTEMAKLDGLDRFEHVTFEPVRLADCTGETHDFHLRTHLFGTGVALDAFELRDGHPADYQFQIIGDPLEDMLVLLGRLIEKVGRGLSNKHVRNDGSGPQIADHRIVRGNIEWDDFQGGSAPLPSVDGREITWQEFGRMLMSVEGWQFKLEIRDKSEDL